MPDTTHEDAATHAVPFCPYCNGPLRLDGVGEISTTWVCWGTGCHYRHVVLHRPSIGARLEEALRKYADRIETTGE